MLSVIGTNNNRENFIELLNSIFGSDNASFQKYLNSYDVIENAWNELITNKNITPEELNNLGESYFESYIAKLDDDKTFFDEFNKDPLKMSAQIYNDFLKENGSQYTIVDDLTNILYLTINITK